MKFSLFCLSLLLCLPSWSQVPRVDTEAMTGCEDCGKKPPVLEVKASGGNPTFPLSKCRGIRNDRFGKGAWGAPRRHGSHTGVDWKSPLGSPLKSPWSGRVTYAGFRSKAAGYTIKIDHDNGYSTVYMHLQKNIKVKRGQKVGAGQQIGFTSNSGNARGTNPHLHFEVFKNGRRLNPTKIFGCR